MASTIPAVGRSQPVGGIRPPAHRVDDLFKILSRKPRRRSLAWAIFIGALAWLLFAWLQSMPAVLPFLKLTANFRFGALLFSVVLLAALVGENRRGAARYRSILDTAPDASAVVDTNGLIVFVNAQMERLFGYARHELLGREIEMLMPERFRLQDPAHRNGFFSQPRVRSIGAALDLFGLHKDGREFPIEISLSPVETESGIFFSGAIRDITERKKAAEELRNSEESFRALVQGVKDCAILMLDTAGRIVSWNEGAQRITGYTEEETVGRHFSFFYTPEDVDARKPDKELQEAAAAGYHESEVWHIRKNGSRYWANVNISALWDDGGNLRGFSKITRNATERRDLTNDLSKRNADLAAANKELEAFTYSVAHDLRSPLRHIYGFSKILADDFGPRLPPEVQGFLSDILQGAEKMGRLIDDLLSLARLSRQEARLQVTRLGTLLDEVIRDLNPEIGDRNIKWRVQELPYVLCDAGLAKQVLMNLVSNAVKYSRPRKPAIIEIGQICLDGEIVLYVRDNGVGFSMKYANKLFGVFQRLHRAEDFEGTGIGLAIVQRIVHKHGGRIWAEAELDKGATFYFTFGTPDATQPQGELAVAGRRGEADGS